MKRPSIGDVARRAGVSTATVSRSLNAPETVLEATRARVAEAVAALHYVPSDGAVNFKKQRARTALVVARDLGNIYYSELFRGVQRRAEEAGYAITIAPPGRAGEGGAIVSQLRAGRVDGAIVLSGLASAGEEEALLAPRFGPFVPLVRLSEHRDALTTPRILVDNVAGARLAAEHLIARGHRRLGHVTAPPGTEVGRARLEGFSRAIAAAGLVLDPGHVYPGGFDIGAGRDAARAFLAGAARPTAILAANDEAAMGFVSEIARAGLAVPRDVSVIGFDDIALSAAYVPALTTIHQPRECIGREAMDLLLRLIAREEAAAGAVVELPLHLVVRDSVAPPSRP